jgi:hypothetical protein
MSCPADVRSIITAPGSPSRIGEEAMMVTISRVRTPRALAMGRGA